MNHRIQSDYTQTKLMDVTRESAGWEYLTFRVIRLQPGERYVEATGGDEVALVPLQGAGTLSAGGQQWAVARESVFTQLPHVLYVPPGQEIQVEASSMFEFALGGAPASGQYPVRLFTPDEQRVEVRGGGPAVREVHHTLAWPLPAERLILFEVYVPGGAWSGWPPHCHDRVGNSPYLEEIYYYRIQPENGVAFHRNYRRDTDFDEVIPAHHGDCVLVTQGFHPVAATPGSNIYFLNYLAGEPQNAERDYRPFEDPDTTWIKDNWDANKMTLPIQWK
ncbi:MAG: 5-deoxy-glucuronate isomerase [Caldilineaceae bacterium]|nr:5-deoxy-glucuronate isomerase [Caldilineaceae bacterium]